MGDSQRFLSQLRLQPWFTYKQNELAIIESCLDEVVKDYPSLLTQLTSTLARDLIYLEPDKKSRYLSKTKQEKLEEKRQLQQLAATRLRIDQIRGDIEQVKQLKEVVMIKSNARYYEDQLANAEVDTRRLRHNLIELVNCINFSLEMPTSTANGNANDEHNNQWLSMSEYIETLMRHNCVRTINQASTERDRFLEELCFAQFGQLDDGRSQLESKESKIVNAYSRVVNRNLEHCLMSLSELLIKLCKFINLHTQVAPAELEYRQALQRLVRLFRGRQRGWSQQHCKVPDIEYYDPNEIDQIKELLKLPLELSKASAPAPAPATTTTTTCPLNTTKI